MRNVVTLTESLLVKGLKELSLPYTREQVGLFMSYLAELKKWNKAYNLTSLKKDEDIITKHFLDSLLYLKALPHGGISLIDVGSGAGFPGIPMKIMRPEITMHLLEPSRKKANFLRHAAKTLGLDKTEVIEKRLEDLEELTVDVAVTRALFDIGEFFEKASPFVKKGGRLILSKGPKVSEELKAVERKGLDYEVLTLTLPLTNIKRFIVVIRNASSDMPADAGSPSRSARPHIAPDPNICINAQCRLRKAGCRGFEGCPGYKARA